MGGVEVRGCSLVLMIQVHGWHVWSCHMKLSQDMDRGCRVGIPWFLRAAVYGRHVRGLAAGMIQVLTGTSGKMSDVLAATERCTLVNVGPHVDRRGCCQTRRAGRSQVGATTGASLTRVHHSGAHKKRHTWPAGNVYECNGSSLLLQ